MMNRLEKGGDNKPKMCKQKLCSQQNIVKYLDRRSRRRWKKRRRIRINRRRQEL
jgi:hypothetical protein